MGKCGSWRVVRNNLLGEESGEIGQRPTEVTFGSQDL